MGQKAGAEIAPTGLLWDFISPENESRTTATRASLSNALDHREYDVLAYLGIQPNLDVSVVDITLIF